MDGYLGRLADAAELEFRSVLSDEGVEPPTIAPMFVPLDALDESSYRGLTYQLSSADLIVLNYLFSENISRIGQAQQAINFLAKHTSGDCLFAVIDRLENNPRFSQDVENLFQAAFGLNVEHNTLGGTLDRDEQTSEMGEMLVSTLRRTPRVKFFTDMRRDPTVFWFVIKRG